MKKSLSAIIISFVMVFTLFGGVTFADENDNGGIPTEKTVNLTEKKSNQNPGSFSPMAYNYNTKYLKLNKPISHAVYYKGEKMTFKFTASDTWTYWFSEPNIFLRRESTGAFYKHIRMENVSVDRWSEPYSYSFYLPKSMPSGKYTAGVMLVPVDAYDNLPDDYDYTDYDEPISYSTITIRKLYAPGNVKAYGGKRKATITWSKATGAQKYYVYRSTKKSSGYKYIGKTTNRKFVDKKVRRHKRYYYKVKSVRTYRSLLKSNYSYRASARTK